MTDATADLRADVLGAFRRRRMVALSVPVLLVLYMGYVFAAFDVAGLAERARRALGAIHRLPRSHGHVRHGVDVARGLGGVGLRAGAGAALAALPEPHPPRVLVELVAA